MLTFGNIMTQNAVKYRQKTAVIYKNATWTYEELNKRGNRLANAFLQKGYKKGDKVAIMMKNNSTYIEIIVGLSKIGVVIVPINFRAVGPEIAYIIEHSESRGYITTREYKEEFARVGRAAEQIDTYLVVEENYENFLHHDATEPVNDVVETDTLYLGYTSGTTGKPKGVVISHRARMLTALVTAAEYKIDESDIHAVVGPIYHAAPWIFLMTQLTAGGTIVVEEAYRPEQFLADVEKYGITNTFMAPTMYNFLTNLPDDIIKKYHTNSLRVFISAGSALPTQTKNAILHYFPNVDLHEFYGATESAVTLNIKPKDLTRKESCVGQPFPFVECLIVDEHMQPVKQGEVGELYFKGPYLLDEYYRNPEATKQAFWNGYFSVGELARQDEEGYYYIIDRKKDMLISGGVNIYPREIEEVLYGHPAVLEVAVIGIPDPTWGESVQAVVALKEGQHTTAQEIIAFCEGKMASYKKPRYVSFVDELPRNPSGKILKVELRNQYTQ